MPRTMSASVKVALIGAAATVTVGILTVAWPNKKPAPKMLVVGGIIVDTSRAPIGGASITTTGEPWVITSGTSGIFTFPVPASNSSRSIQIRVDKKGYGPWIGQLQLPSSDNVIQLDADTPAQTPIADGSWSGTVPEIDTTIGGGNTCIYAVRFKNIVTSFTVEVGTIKVATLTYTYDDAATNCSIPSGIRDTQNQFALGSFVLGSRTLHVDLIQKSGGPAATATLDAVADGTSVMKGRLTITRTDSSGTLNWNVVQTIPLSK